MYGDPKYFFKFIEGAILGFATADALGVPVEFTSREERKQDPVYEMRGGGAHGQPAGTWSDDTSMTLCMIHSLIEKGIDFEDQMVRFADWMENGNYTARGDVFDIGGATHRAISKHLRGKPALECGDDSDNACGNGSLMRIMPLAFFLEGKAIAMTSNRLELPNRSEGFDELYFVGNDGQNMTISEWREEDEL